EARVSSACFDHSGSLPISALKNAISRPDTPPRAPRQSSGCAATKVKILTRVHIASAPVVGGGALSHPAKEIRHSRRACGARRSRTADASFPAIFLFPVALGDAQELLLHVRTSGRDAV